MGNIQESISLWAALMILRFFLVLSRNVFTHSFQSLSSNLPLGAKRVSFSLHSLVLESLEGRYLVSVSFSLNMQYCQYFFPEHSSDSPTGWIASERVLLWGSSILSIILHQHNLSSFISHSFIMEKEVLLGIQTICWEHYQHLKFHIKIWNIC